MENQAENMFYVSVGIDFRVTCNFSDYVLEKGGGGVGGGTDSLRDLGVLLM